MIAKRPRGSIREQDQSREQEPGDMRREQINKTPEQVEGHTLSSEPGESSDVLTAEGGPTRSATSGPHANFLGRP